MKELRVYLVDDEQRALDTLSKVLTQFFTHIKVVGKASALEEAVAGIQESKPDLVFLDIEMGSHSGFELLERFDKVNFHVVFVTAFEEYALKAIKFSALDYIIKPAAISELKALFTKLDEAENPAEENERVKQLFKNADAGNKNEHRISLAVAEGYEFVKVNDILYLRAEGSYTTFFLKDGSRITSSKNLKFFEGVLEGYNFFRIHNSTIIHLRYMKRFGKAAGGFVVMDNDEEFSVSKSRKEEFMQVLSLR